MKTRVFTIALIASAAVLASGCIKDDRDNFMVADSFGLTARTTVVEASIHTGSCSFGISKNGKGATAAKVDIIVGIQAQDSLNRYNQINKTDYKALPANMFELGSSRLEYDVKDVVKEGIVKWDPVVLSQFIQDNGKYVIPVVIESKSLNVNPEHSFIIIHLNRTTVKLTQSSVKRIVEKDTVDPENVILDVTLDNVMKGIDIAYPVSIDNSLIESYNKGSEIQYAAAPEGLVKLGTSSVHIPGGARGATISVSIDYSVLIKDGQVEEFPPYLVPVKVDRDAISAVYKNEPFQIKGLDHENMVTYLSFTYYAPPPGLSVIRKWGKFSTETDSWSSFIPGFTAGTDRNVTMDDQYIYIPETSETTSNIWRLNINSPETVSKAAAPVNPTGHFKVTAARIMDPGTTKMNGGKPMLIVSNMVMDEQGPMLKLYIYDKGTDAAPSEWKMGETNLGRRLGDIFTTHGTFANGGFLFKDWNQTYGNGTILVWRTAFESVPNYDQTPRNPTWNTIKDEGGRAAFYPYPGQATPQKGIYTGTESAYYVTENGNNVYTWNASSFNAVAASDYYKGASDFNFFEYKGKRYIAYVKTVSSSDGRFYVLEGELGDDWQDILDSKRNVIFQASIQADVQFSDGEYHPELEEPSPKSSGNSGCGCAAVTIGEEVFIVAGKQNVGLSLFRMSYAE